jgi:micrococcal nuclease
MKKLVIYLLVPFLLDGCSGCTKSGRFKSKNKVASVVSPSIEKDAEYKVIGIVDGDTYDVLKNNETIRIRVNAIDAPEKGMPFYRVSKEYLSSLCFGKFVKLDIVKKDQHDRFVARAILPDGIDIPTEMIKAGMAWHFKEFSSDETLSELENTARQNKIGLWKDGHPIEPWKIRKLHREGISTKDSFDLSSEN